MIFKDAPVEKPRLVTFLRIGRIPTVQRLLQAILFSFSLAAALGSTQCVANGYPLGAVKLAEKIFRIFISAVGHESRSE
jgi:hypothetical protein